MQTETVSPKTETFTFLTHEETLTWMDKGQNPLFPFFQKAFLDFPRLRPSKYSERGLEQPYLALRYDPDL